MAPKKRKQRPSIDNEEENEEALKRTGTVLLQADKELENSDLSGEEEEKVTPTHSPVRKKKKVSNKKLTYATTNVLRTLDEEGEEVPLVQTLRSASFHTKKILQMQLLKERKAVTPEQTNARKVINILRKSFVPLARYSYDKQGPSHKWTTKAQLSQFQKLLIPLCESTTEILKKDPMVVKLPSPTYVLGDLHGNYKDLLIFKQNFWNMGVDMTPARFLFLGDYVDRGPHSLELVAYLFALKMIHPDRVVLLRGNHEFEYQNGDEHYDPCFLQNCEELFTKSAAKKIWKAFNSAFEWMPLAASIDGKIFCCHGGIPRIIKEDSEKSIVEQIESIERPLKDDDVDDAENKLAMDLLWSDPATVKEEKKLEDGWFGPNERGGEIQVFGQKAVEAFVKKTGFTHLIRAHQPPNAGIEYAKGARIITVFSSSHYCGGYNSAAIVLVNEGRLRVATTEQTHVQDSQDDEEEEENVELSSEDEVIVEQSYENENENNDNNSNE